MLVSKQYWRRIFCQSSNCSPGLSKRVGWWRAPGVSVGGLVDDPKSQDDCLAWGNLFGCPQSHLLLAPSTPGKLGIDKKKKSCIASVLARFRGLKFLGGESGGDM